MNKWKAFPSILGGIERGDNASEEHSVNPMQRGIIRLDREKVIHALIAVASNAWKAKSRLSRADSQMSSDVERLARHVNAIIEALESMGLEIKEHTGEPFDYGQSLKVAASQAKEGISREVVSETIRPTIYLNGVMIQQGEVVIDVPMVGARSDK